MFQQLIEFMPQRIKAIPKAKLGPTWYWQSVKGKVAADCRDPALKRTYSRCVHVSAEPASWLRGREAVDKLVGGAGFVLGHILQMDGLLQEDLPLDAGPVVSLNSIDHLDTNINS